MRPARLFALTAAVALLAGPAPAATVALPIFQEPSGGSPSTNRNYTVDTNVAGVAGQPANQGTDPFFYASNTVSGMLWFPNLFGSAADQLPTTGDITVDSAVLSLCIANTTIPAGVTLSFYKITSSWAESTDTVPGVVATPLQVTQLTPLHKGTGNLFDITSVVQEWANAGGAGNFGILIKTNKATVLKFGSSDNTSLGEHPTLTVKYSTQDKPTTGVVPTPAGAVLLGIGGLLAAARGRFRKAVVKA